MRTELPLRDYQRDALDRVYDSLSAGVQRPAVVLPTGAGKTVVFSHLAREWDKGRILILVHRDELATQTRNKIAAIAPHLSVGIVKAGRDEVDADVIVGSVQTLRSDRRISRLMEISLVIVDECHHATADSYMSVLRNLGCFSKPGVPAIGFTATMDRSDKKSAKIGLGDVWEEIVFTRDILDMIGDGHLADPRGVLVTIDGMSLSDVKVSRGDFSETSLSDMLLSNDAQEIVARAYVEHARERKGLLFAPTVKAAHAFAEALRAQGITTAVVHGSMPDHERRTALADFTAGRVQVLSNCMVLTEGYDEPSASVCVIARPTKSAALYQQMTGRVLRPYPGKTDALVIDVIGATEEHSLASLADLASGRIDKVEPGESLTGAAKRLAKKGVLALKGYAIGRKAVDLFGRSTSMWSQTNAGIWFVATGCSAGEKCEWATDGRNGQECRGHLVFLWPGSEPTTYRVGVRPTYTKGGRFVSEDVDLNTAMALGEQAIAETDSGFITSRRASWRKRPAPASEAQLRFAARLRIEVPEDATKADVSDLINIAVASNVLDGKIKKTTP